MLYKINPALKLTRATPNPNHPKPSPPLRLHRLHQPIHALRHAPPINRRASHDTPIAIPELAQPQRLGNIAGAPGAGLVLLIGEDQQGGVAELVFVQHGGEFGGGGGQAVDVRAVDDEDDGGRVGVVAAPVGADGGLPAEVLCGG